MTISLPEDLKQFVKKRSLTAHYGTPSDYIRGLIREDLQRLETDAGRSCPDYQSEASITAMLSPSQFSPEAWDDMRAIVAYIATDNPDAAARFVPALAATYTRLAALPGMGSVRHFRRKDLQGVRMLPVTGFEHYLLFYTALRKRVKVLRILHASRDFPTIFE